MRKVFLSAAVVALLGVGMLQTSCMGSFKLTNSLYDWNRNVSKKFVNELIFVGFCILPVYGVTLFVDGFILNSIEFWSGGDVFALKPGEEQIKIAEKNGEKYEIKATYLRYDITQLEGKNKGETCALIFDENDSSWSIEGNMGKRKLMKILKSGEVVAYMPDGREVTLDGNVNPIDMANTMMVATK